MPVWSISQQRAAVGTMAAIVAHHRHKQPHNNNEYQIQHKIYRQKVLYLIFLLLSSFKCKIEEKVIEEPTAVESPPNIQNKPLQPHEARNKGKRRNKGSLIQIEFPSCLEFKGVGLRLLLVLVNAVSAFLIELLLMQSGDVEPNPGPTLLTEKQLPKLVNVLHNIQDKCHSVGVQLGVPYGTLSAIKSDRTSLTERFTELLRTWILTNPKACWEDLLDVLTTPTIGQDRIAVQLRDHQCPQHRLPTEIAQGCTQTDPQPILSSPPHSFPLSDSTTTSSPVTTVSCTTSHNVDPNIQLLTQTTTQTDSNVQLSGQTFTIPTIISSSLCSQQLTPNVHSTTCTNTHPSVRPTSSSNSYPTSLQNVSAAASSSIQLLQTAFTTLLRSTQELVEGMDPLTFNSALMAIPTDKIWNKRFSMTDLLANLEETTPTAEVWAQLQSDLHCLDSSLLECVTEIFGTRNSQQMKTYMKCLSEISDITWKPGAIEGVRKSQKLKIEVVLRRSGEGISYGDIEECRNLLTLHCFLPAFAVSFGGVDTGSKSVCFYAVTTATRRLLSDKLPLLSKEAHHRMRTIITYVAISGMTYFHENLQFESQTTIEKIEDYFFEVTETIGSEIVKTSPTELWKKISNLPVCQKWHKSFVLRELFPLKNNIDELWENVKLYSNFLNTGLLELSIKAIDKAELKQKMREYKHAVDLFRSRTKLKDFIESWPCPDTEPPKKKLIEVVKLKVNKTWEECTLRDLEEAKQSLTSRFFLPGFAVFLQTAFKSSVHIFLRTATSVADILEEQLREKNSLEEVDFSTITVREVEYMCQPQTPPDCKSRNTLEVQSPSHSNISSIDRLCLRVEPQEPPHLPLQLEPSQEELLEKVKLENDEFSMKLKENSIEAKILLKETKNQQEEDETKGKPEQKMHKEETQSFVAKMNKNIERLLMQMFQVLSRSDTSPQSFCSSLAAGLVGVQEHIFNSVTEDWLARIETENNSEKAWDFLKQQLLLLTNYLNYGPLQYIISTYGNYDLKRDMRQYDQQHKTFQSCSRVQHLSGVWPRMGSISQTSELTSVVQAEVVVETRRPWQETSLGELYSIQMRLSSHFFLPRFSLLLSHAHKSGGDVCITFLTSPSIVKLLRVKSSKEWFEEAGLHSMSVEGELIFISAHREFSSHLRQLYSSRQPQPLVNWTTPLHKELHFYLAKIEWMEVKEDMEKFTSSTLRGDEDDVILLQKSPMSLDEIGQLADGVKAQLMLMEGAPGVGKSTASLYLCQQHGQGQCLSDYSVLVLLPLRDNQVRSAHNWQDLLYHPDSVVKKAFAKEIESTNGRGILFILDGWDELSEELRTQSSIFLDLVTGQALPEASVLVTSRPWASRQLRQQLQKRPSQHIELVGTSDQQVREYSQEMMESSQQPKAENRQQFISYINSNPVIKALMFTPATQQLIIAVFNTNPQSLPTTSTELYRHFTLLVLQRYLSSHPLYQSEITSLQDWSDLPVKVEQQFYRVCQIAFSGLEQGQQIVFSNLSFDFDSLGLMVAVHELHGTKGGPVSHNFLNLSLQEFLAAVHISRLPADQQLLLVNKYFHRKQIDVWGEKHYESTQFKAPFQFLAGLTKLTMFPTEQLKRFLEEDPVSIILYHWVFESGTQTLLSDLHGTGHVKLRSKKEWTAVDYYVIGYCISHSKCTWGLTFVDYTRTQYLIKGCCEYTVNSTGTITSADFSRSSLTAEGIKEWHLIPSHIVSGMTQLNFYSNLMDSTACNELATLIPHMTSLKRLEMTHNPIGEGGSVQLITALGGCSQLKELRMWRTRIGPADTRRIAKCLLLSDTVTLEQLWLGGNRLPPESVGHILNALVKRRSVVVLNISDSKLSRIAVGMLVNLLSHPVNCALRILYMNDCGIDSSSAHAISKSLCVNKTLHELYLSSNYIRVEGAKWLAEAIKENTTLVCLTLYDNPLGRVDSLLKALEHNKTLELGISDELKKSLPTEMKSRLKW